MQFQHPHPRCSPSLPFSRDLPASARRLSLKSPSLLVGAALFGGGLLLESVADWQKFKWKSDPGGYYNRHARSVPVQVQDPPPPRTSKRPSRPLQHPVVLATFPTAELTH